MVYRKMLYLHWMIGKVHQTMYIAAGVKKSTSPTLVISTFGLAEIISCIPDGLVKKIYQILTNLSIFEYLIIFIYAI